MRRPWMRVVAVSVLVTGTDTASGHQTLELIVRPNAIGRLDAASQDAGPQLCRLLHARREEWSGYLRAEGNRWARCVFLLRRLPVVDCLANLRSRQ